MMWEQIRSNRIRSAVLVGFMAALLLGIGYFLGLYFFDSPVAGLVIALVVWGIMSLVAFFQGDSIILASARARKIKKEDYPRLYNVVEEMKIASGLEKMPDIYIIDEPALNAFATGRNPDKASVAITSGLLQKLNRDELQGVIAHELAHIKNRDVLLMAITTVMLGTIVILSWYASRFLIFGSIAGGRSRRSSAGGGGYGQIIILVIGLVALILAPIAAQLIYFAVSRKREYLADASGSLYTRYPEGLASALEKLAEGPALKSANKATSPMYITNPFRTGRKSLSELTSTHPPLADRIRILRSMAGGSYADYEKAYRQVRGKGILPSSAVASAGAVGLRGPSEGSVGEDTLEQKARTREVTGVMERLSNYRVIDCPCGARLKVPPEYRGNRVQCPRCGRGHGL